MKVTTRFISDLHIGHNNVIRFSKESYDHWVRYERELPGEKAHKRVQLLSYLPNIEMDWAQPEIPDTMEEWNNRIKTNWNAVVNALDETWIVGDVAMKGKSDPEFVWKFLNELKGKIHIVPGNHDDEFLDHIFKHHGGEFDGHWNNMMSLATGPTTNLGTKITIEPQIVKTFVPMPNGKPAKKVIISHYPLYSFESCGFDATLIFGHIHNMFDQNQDFLKMMKDGIWTYNPEIEKKPGRAVNVGCMLPWIDFIPRTLEWLEKDFIDLYYIREAQC